jgi:hypothetical protein
MTHREFWQAVYLAVVAKHGVGPDGARYAADKALKDLEDYEREHPDKEP